MMANTIFVYMSNPCSIGRSIVFITSGCTCPTKQVTLRRWWHSIVLFRNTLKLNNDIFLTFPCWLCLVYKDHVLKFTERLLTLILRKMPTFSPHLAFLTFYVFQVGLGRLNECCTGKNWSILGFKKLKWIGDDNELVEKFSITSLVEVCELANTGRKSGWIGPILFIYWSFNFLWYEKVLIESSSGNIEKENWWVGVDVIHWLTDTSMYRHSVMSLNLVKASH